MCIPDSRYGLSLAWVTSENSTMLLESDILRFFFTGPHLVSSPLCSGVWCWLPLRSSTPTSAVRLLLSSLNCLLSALQPPTASLGSSHQLPLLLSNYQLSLLVSCHQLSSLLSNCQLLSPVQLPTASLGLLPPTTNCLSLGRVVNSHSRVPLPLPDTARFHVQESFVWFRAKTDSSALAACPHSAT